MQKRQRAVQAKRQVSIFAVATGPLGGADFPAPAFLREIRRS
jgi:hypothetical protein